MTDQQIEVYVEDTKELTVPVMQKLDYLKKVPIFIGKYKLVIYSVNGNQLTVKLQKTDLDSQPNFN